MLKKSIVLIVLMMSFAFALTESNIKTEMSAKIDQITTVLQNTTLSSTYKEETISSIIDDVFDYSTMAKISLSKKWKTLSSSQQSSFTKAFEQKLKTSYFEKLELYSNQEVKIKELKKVKATRILLYSDIIGTEETYEVVYKFFKAHNSNDWRIYDVEITGVSIIQTYRKQFAEFLKTKSFDALLASL